MSSEPLLAKDLIAFNDTELDQYLDRSRLPNGDRVVRVLDPQNLPDSFVQRLRDRASSHPHQTLDLNEVSTRLQSIANLPDQDETSVEGGFDPSWPYPPCIPETMTDEERTARFIREETAYHKVLVEGGGRPWYPIEQLPAVARNGQEFDHLRVVWATQPHRPLVFGRQLRDWGTFLSNNTIVRRNATDGLRQYTEDARKRLAAMSVLRPFHFDPDFSLQDPLTTWLEYINHVLMHEEKLVRNGRTDLLKQYADRRPWYFEQIPLIEAEMAQSSAAVMTGGKTSRKRAQRQHDETDEEHPPAKRKKTTPSAPAPPPLPRTTRRTARTATTQGGSPASQSRKETVPQNPPTLPHVNTPDRFQRDNQPRGKKPAPARQRRTVAGRGGRREACKTAGAPLRRSERLAARAQAG